MCVCVWCVCVCVYVYICIRNILLHSQNFIEETINLHTYYQEEKTNVAP